MASKYDFSHREYLQHAGSVFLDVFKGDELIERREFKASVKFPKAKNLIVAEGKTRVANMLLGVNCDSFIKFIAVGTGTAAAQDSDKYLQIKSAGRVLQEFVVTGELCPAVFSTINPNSLETPPVARFEIVIGENELVGDEIGEVMLVFNDKQVMLARKALGGTILKGAGFSIRVTWFVVIS